MKTWQVDINSLSKAWNDMQKPETQRLVTALFNNDDAEINRIIGARLESVFNKRVAETSKVIFEGMVSGDENPQLG